MSKTTHTDKRSGAGKSRRPRTASKTETMQSAQERGTARGSLLDALRANPNSTTAELAEKAEIGRSTAGKILARLADEGTVTRISGIATGGRRPADRWISGHDDTPARTAPAAHVDEPKPSAESAKTQRLAPGGLQDMVLGHLRAHPGEEFGPSQLGKTLGRSAGAINNALESLAKDGAVVKTVEAPKRFSAISNGNNAPDTRTKASK